MKMRSVIQIKNRGNDEMCCARAIVTGIVRIENDPNWNSIRKKLWETVRICKHIAQIGGCSFWEMQGRRNQMV